MSNLKYIDLKNFTSCKGQEFSSLSLSYEIFGKPLGTAPVVVINHALTGNSTVIGDAGWWNALFGSGKLIDTDRYTIIAFNVPGNGYDGFVLEDYKVFIARDAAKIFNLGLDELGVKDVFAVIGGSVGGGIAWEMAALRPNLIRHLIPVASDWKSTDWLIANCCVQEEILNNSSKPLQDARMHAMLFYRSHQSLEAKFGRSVNEEKNLFNVETWLLHHGHKLQKRFQLPAYKLMNYLLKTIDITEGRGTLAEVVKPITADIHMVGINSDFFFTSGENKRTLEQIRKVKNNIYYSEIDSIHGHDAFLIEFKQLETILSGIFKK